MIFSIASYSSLSSSASTSSCTFSLTLSYWEDVFTWDVIACVVNTVWNVTSYFFLRTAITSVRLSSASCST